MRGEHSVLFYFHLSQVLYRAKYPLVVVSRLLDAFGKGLSSGYDIGCKFKTTLSRSSLAEPARLLAHTSLVGSFHGHAHGRLCQLDHLATYVEGLGLEDLEGCERAFSKSNVLASTVHYSGIFHCRQAIANYFEHNDEYDVYANLCVYIFPPPRLLYCMTHLYSHVPIQQLQTSREHTRRDPGAPAAAQT